MRISEAEGTTKKVSTESSKKDQAAEAASARHREERDRFAHVIAELRSKIASEVTANDAIDSGQVSTHKSP